MCKTSKDSCILSWKNIAVGVNFQCNFKDSTIGVFQEIFSSAIIIITIKMIIIIIIIIIIMKTMCPTSYHSGHMANQSH